MINKTVLGNGVRIVTEKVPAVHSVTIGVWVKTGSRHENGSESGLAHFIEHMLFKGTDKRNACEIARVIDSVGGSINAFTSKEYTCFYPKTDCNRMNRGNFFCYNPDPVTKNGLIYHSLKYFIFYTY